MVNSSTKYWQHQLATLPLKFVFTIFIKIIFLCFKDLQLTFCTGFVSIWCQGVPLIPSTNCLQNRLRWTIGSTVWLYVLKRPPNLRVSVSENLKDTILGTNISPKKFPYFCTFWHFWKDDDVPFQKKVGYVIVPRRVPPAFGKFSEKQSPKTNGWKLKMKLRPEIANLVLCLLPAGPRDCSSMNRHVTNLQKTTSFFDLYDVSLDSGRFTVWKPTLLMNE